MKSGDEKRNLQIITGRPPMKPRKAIKRKTDKRKQMQELDLLVREYVFERAGHRCERCGGDNVLQASHILSKGVHQRMRFEPHNLVALCRKCHIFWWHKSPLEAAQWLNEKWPTRYQELLIMDRTCAKPDVKDLIVNFSAIAKQQQ